MKEKVSEKLEREKSDCEREWERAVTFCREKRSGTVRENMKRWGR